MPVGAIYASVVAHPQMFDDDDPMLVRVRELVAGLPGTDEKVSHGRPAFCKIDEHNSALCFITGGTLHPRQ